LIGSYVAQEWAICRIVDGFVFEAPCSISAAMSAYGTKQTLISMLNMSAYGGKADIPDRLADVR